MDIPEGSSNDICSAWKPKDLLREVEERLERGFGGLCKFLQSLAPTLRFTMHELRGILLHTRLWCCAGMHSSKPSSFQISAADALRAWSVAPLRVIGASSQEPRSDGVDAGGLRLDQTQTQTRRVTVKSPVRKKTTIIRSSDTTMFGSVHADSYLIVCQFCTASAISRSVSGMMIPPGVVCARD